MIRMLTALALLTGCQYLPQIAQDVEDIANDDVLRIEMSKGAIHPKSEIHLMLDVTNGVE